jgi:hypothetical protein
MSTWTLGVSNRSRIAAENAASENRVLLHREIGIDAEPAPRPPAAALVIVAHLFGQAEPVVLV